MKPWIALLASFIFILKALRHIIDFIVKKIQICVPSGENRSAIALQQVLMSQ